MLWPTNTSGDRPLCVGSTPVSKGFANFSVFLFFNFSVLKQGVDPRVQRTHFSQHLVLYGAKSGALESDFSDTFELGRDAYREIVELSYNKKF